jgi:hypothetical protein
MKRTTMFNHKRKILQILSSFLVVVICQSATGCKKERKEESPLLPPVKDLVKRNITIDKSAKYQAIDGFGFFGAAYLTTSGVENCIEAGTLKPGYDNHFELPPMSVVTLQAGGNSL